MPEPDQRRTSLPPIDFSAVEDQATAAAKTKKSKTKGETGDQPPTADPAASDASGEKSADRTESTQSSTANPSSGNTPGWVKLTLPLILLASVGLGIVAINQNNQISELESSVSFWRSEARDFERDLDDLVGLEIKTSDVAGASFDGSSLAIPLTQTACEGWGTCDAPPYDSTTLKIDIACDGSTCQADDTDNHWWSGDLQLRRSAGTWTGTKNSSRGTRCQDESNPDSANTVSLELTASAATLQQGGELRAERADAQLVFEVDTELNCSDSRIVLAS